MRPPDNACCQNGAFSRTVSTADGSSIVCVVYRSFYPTTSVHPESVLIHPREIPGTNFVVTDDCERE